MNGFDEMDEMEKRGGMCVHRCICVEYVGHVMRSPPTHAYTRLADAVLSTPRAIGPRSGLRFSYYEDTLIKSSGFENRIHTVCACDSQSAHSPMIFEVQRQLSQHVRAFYTFKYSTRTVYLTDRSGSRDVEVHTI